MNKLSSTDALIRFRDVLQEQYNSLDIAQKSTIRTRELLELILDTSIKGGEDEIGRSVELCKGNFSQGKTDFLYEPADMFIKRINRIIKIANRRMENISIIKFSLLKNFNDFFMGFFTCFHLMMVNNWLYTVRKGEIRIYKLV